ncbi:unnamed protein product [Closterium sp. NIES-64]|nr:unnamed protein product [Closterium sp. NIES-64]
MRMSDRAIIHDSAPESRAFPSARQRARVTSFSVRPSLANRHVALPSAHRSPFRLSLYLPPVALPSARRSPFHRRPSFPSSSTLPPVTLPSSHRHPFFPSPSLLPIAIPSSHRHPFFPSPSFLPIAIPSSHRPPCRSLQSLPLVPSLSPSTCLLVRRRKGEGSLSPRLLAFPVSSLSSSPRFPRLLAFPVPSNARRPRLPSRLPSHLAHLSPFHLSPHSLPSFHPTIPINPPLIPPPALLTSLPIPTILCPAPHHPLPCSLPGICPRTPHPIPYVNAPPLPCFPPSSDKLLPCSSAHRDSGRWSDLLIPPPLLLRPPSASPPSPLRFSSFLPPLLLRPPSASPHSPLLLPPFASPPSPLHFSSFPPCFPLCFLLCRDFTFSLCFSVPWSPLVPHAHPCAHQVVDEAGRLLPVVVEADRLLRQFYHDWLHADVAVSVPVLCGVMHAHGGGSVSGVLPTPFIHGLQSLHLTDAAMSHCLALVSPHRAFTVFVSLLHAAHSLFLLLSAFPPASLPVASAEFSSHQPQL